MRRSLLWCAVVLTLGAPLAACGSPKGAAVTPASTPGLPRARVTGSRSDLSLDEVYRRMEQAITQTGKVFHARARIVSVQSTFPTPTPESGKATALPPDFSQLGPEEWFDTTAGVGRIEQSYASSVSRLIVRRDETFRVGDHDNASVSSLRCRGSDSPLLARLMGCGNYLEKSQTTVNSAEYDGRSAVALVTEGVLPDEDSRSAFKSTLYLDSATWLPLAGEDEQTRGSERVSFFTVYETSFVDRASLALDFFEPASIGYVERDPEGPLKSKDAGIPLYWLGTSLKAAAGLPELVLRSSGVTTPNPAFPPRYRAALEYGSASDKQGPSLVAFQEFATADWDAFIEKSHGGNIWDGAPSDTITLPDGHAVLFRIPASWNGDRYLAQIFEPQTVILVTDFDSPSPYNTRAGFEAIVHALVKR